MEMRYDNLRQFISDIREQVQVDQVVGALRHLPHLQVEDLQAEFNVSGLHIIVLARTMLREFEKPEKR